jgi:hypothetical protein
MTILLKRSRLSGIEPFLLKITRPSVWRRVRESAARPYKEELSVRKVKVNITQINVFPVPHGGRQSLIVSERWRGTSYESARRLAQEAACGA